MGRALLYLVRHGDPDHQADQADPGLSDLGREQAGRLGRRLAGVPFDAIRHSPLRRAAQTAEMLAGCLPGVPAGPSDLLADRTPVPPGLDLAGIPPDWQSFLDRVPAGERDPGAAALDDALGRLADAGDADRCELLVTHNFVIGWFVGRALDAPGWRWLSLNQFCCALTILSARPGRPLELITFNDLGHLPPGVRGQAPLRLPS